MNDLFEGNPVDPNVLVFTVPGEPTGKGRPRTTIRSGFAREYTPAKTRNYENLIKLAFQQAYPGHEPFPKGTPLKIEMAAYFSIPESWSIKKKKLALAGYIRPTKKPDTDNISKIKDALNGIAWYDDAQVVEDTIKKYYSDRPKLGIRIEVWKP